MVSARTGSSGLIRAKSRPWGSRTSTDPEFPATTWACSSVKMMCGTYLLPFSSLYREWADAVNCITCRAGGCLGHAGDVLPVRAGGPVLLPAGHRLGERQVLSSPPPHP